MILVSVTRLRLRRLRLLPGFAYYAARSDGQAKRSEGCLHAEATRERGLVFWTITLWRDENSMRAFRNAGAHRAAMPRLANWCDEATYVRWQQEDTRPPTVAEAFSRLRLEGVVSKVLHPSPAHATRDFPPPA